MCRPLHYLLLQPCASDAHAGCREVSHPAPRITTPPSVSPSSPPVSPLPFSLHSLQNTRSMSTASLLPPTFFLQTHYIAQPISYSLFMHSTRSLSLSPSHSYNLFYQYFCLGYFSFSSLSCCLSLKISSYLALLFSPKAFSHLKKEEEKKKVRGGKDDAAAYLFWTIRKSDEADDFSRFGSRPAARSRELWSMALSYGNSKTKGREEAMHYVATNQSHGKTTTAGHDCQTEAWVIIWLIINYYLGFWTKAQPAKGWQWQRKTNEAWSRDNTKKV